MLRPLLAAAAVAMLLSISGLAAAGFVVGVAGPAAAQDDGPTAGLVAEEAATVIDVEPALASFSVRHTYRFANTASSEAFTGFFEVLPVGARDVTAVVDGVSVDVVSLPADAGFAEWLIPFPTSLAPGASVSVELAWEIVGLTGDPDDFDRVSDGLVAIAPYAVGQGAASQLVVRVPGEFDVVLADGYDVVVTDEGVELTASRSIDEQYAAIPLVLEAPDRYIRQPLDGPLDITIATPGAPAAWLGDDLAPLVEALSAWVPVAAPEQLEFRQGYTGGGDLRRIDDGVYVLPFDASAAVALRAVAAAWLEPLAFDDIDLRNDFAAALADRVAVAEGVATPPRVGAWVTAMTALASVSDADIAATVLTSLERGVPAYGGSDDTFVASAVDWRRFTDVYEQVGGIESAGDAIRLSASPEQLAELDRRANALVDYRALEARSAPWSMPPLLRDAMAEWRFDDFANAQGAVSDLIGARDEMITAAGAVELEIGDQVQQRFESADTSMDAAWTLYVEQRESLDHVAEALRLDTGDRGLLSTLGMAGRDADAQLAEMQELWASGEFEESAEAAEHLVEDYESSVGRGTLRLLGPLALLVVVIVALRRLRRRRGPAEPQPRDSVA